MRVNSGEWGTFIPHRPLSIGMRNSSFRKSETLLGGDFERKIGSSLLYLLANKKLFIPPLPLFLLARAPHQQFLRGKFWCVTDTVIGASCKLHRDLRISVHLLANNRAQVKQSRIMRIIAHKQCQNFAPFFISYFRFDNFGFGWFFL